MKFIKENIRLVVAVIIAMILIITGVILLNVDKEEANGKTPNQPVEEKVREEQLVDSTGMTKEDAIEIVKENFGSDNYEFEAEATNDGLYKVIVTNTVDDSKIIYYVDPTNGMAYIDLETK